MGERASPASGTGRLSEEQLWSQVDRDAAELADYLARFPDEAERVREMRALIGGLGTLSPEPEQPVEVEGYAILGRLGRGAMGEVLEAEEEHPRRVVALKVLPFELARDARRLELFRREADALARLAHPGLAAIHGVGRCADGRPYISMERVAGLPLDRYVARHAPGRRARLVLAHAICEAVGHAHDRGVVHRDLKPANVLVDERGAPRVVDFGLARIRDEAPAAASLATRAGDLVGTLAYMSPEQAAAEAGELGPRSDVYQLGVLLWELFTGAPPYRLEGLALPEALRRIREAPPRERRFVRRLRGDLRTVVLTALEKDPRRRYENAGALAADLSRVLDGRAIEAATPSLARRLWRAYRRHWPGASLALALFAIGVLLVLPVRWRLPLLPDWWVEGSPFEDVRWVGDTPQVQVGGEWYGLESIDGLRSAFIVGFCQQHARSSWRKRFSEDLVQVLNRMGEWTWRSVDLELRELDTGRIVRREGVPLDGELRRRVWAARREWPWTREREGGVRYAGRAWELVSVEGAEITPGRSGSALYDELCERLGQSPGERVDFVLRDPASGELRAFEDVPRRPMEAGP